MNYNDIISDLIIRIKNAQVRKSLSAKCLNSNLTTSILNTLYKEGYINGYRELGMKEIIVYLKYYLDKPVIRNISRLSKPGQRTYLSAKDLETINSTTELYILSTPQGILSSNEASRLHIGGEALFKIS